LGDPVRLDGRDRMAGMLSGRGLAQVSRGAAAGAHAALAPAWSPDWTGPARPERVIGEGDWEEHERLSEIAARCLVRACIGGWIPVDCPWSSDEENEAVRCLEWDEVLP